MPSKISNILVLVLLLTACQEAKETNVPPIQGSSLAKPFSLDELQQRTFNFFWEQVDANFQTQDRYPTLNFSSTAATGFGLASYVVGTERNFISREEAANRVVQTLRILKNLPQGNEPSGMSGYKGFFYHFLDLKNAKRYKQVELSSIDTGLLMAGVLTAQSFFNKENKTENEIRELADFLYRRVEWDWMLNDENKLSMGWHPEKGFIKNDWHGYNEAMILLVLAMGSPTHPIPADCWKTWTETYQWGKFQGFEFVNFDPLFGHQYSHMFIDFREIQDEYMREKGIDYFENSRRATYSNRAFCIENKNGWKGYDENTWGLTACDGPVGKASGWKAEIGGKKFRSYSARGTPSIDGFDDGTIAPTAAGGSVPFAPEICIPALKNMWEKYYENLIGEYGFKDAFNLTYTHGEGNEQGWFDQDYLGIDQGAILIQVENHRSGLIWEVMKKNKYIVEGLQQAGFEGGWLEKTKTK